MNLEKELPYRSTIKSRPYFYLETKKLAQLVLKGYNEIQLRERVIDHNIFQVKTEARKREIASVILTRLKILDDYLIKHLISSDIRTSKIITLYAILKTDRLFFEFMNEVFSEKLLYRKEKLSDRDFNIFFEGKRQQSNRVASWSEYTFYKLQQVYLRILSEAGLLKSENKTHEIYVPIINPDVLGHIRKSDAKYINVIVGGSYENN